MQPRPALRGRKSGFPGWADVWPTALRASERSGTLALMQTLQSVRNRPIQQSGSAAEEDNRISMWARPQGPEGRPPNVSPARKGWGIDRRVSERRRRGTKPMCHPERTRISCHAALDRAACAPFSKEKRMKLANATKFNRKSGAAEGSAVPRPFLEMCFDRSVGNCGLACIPGAGFHSTLVFVDNEDLCRSANFRPKSASYCN
jgi:hypothetical protein